MSKPASPDVLAVEQQPRIDVPRHAEQLTIDDVGIPDAGKIILRHDRFGGIDKRLQRLQCAERGEFRDPGVAELEDVGQAVGSECGQQFFMRCRPRDVLQLNPDTRVLAFELRQQFGDDFGFAAHRPEFDRGFVALTLATAGERSEQ